MRRSLTTRSTRSTRSLTHGLVAAALALAALGAAGGSPAQAADPFSVTTLHFKVTVGPNDDQTCDVVGDVYVPADASPSRRMPAVLTTNGFGGSKDDQQPAAAGLARRGYVVLSYSGLGFGGSSCKVTLDDPAYDGKAASQLVTYLAGGDGVAYLDAAHTQQAPTLDVVQRDPVDHRGRARSDDPRVGTTGGSYGGGFQFALASIDPRVDALVPFITWNDLSYSLAPNATDQTAGVSTATPGAAKLLWAAGFSAIGLTSDLQNGQVPGDLLPCPNFADFVCPALVTAGATGFLQPDAVAALRSASVSSYLAKVQVPTLLVQGQRDTLFNLNEATATYRALKAQGVETKMIWQQGGHSGPGAPGEVDWNDPSQGYLTGRVLAWFDKHLKGRPVDTGPAFAYFRDWVGYTGSAAPAYATGTSERVGTPRTWRLAGSGELTTSPLVLPGVQTLLTPGAGLPTRLNEFDVVGSYLGQAPDLVGDLPGTSVAWTTAPVTAPLRVAGAPVARLAVAAPSAALTQVLGPAGQLVLFVKVVDVAPDGTARMINGLEAPVRVPDVTKPFRVELPAIVHEFAPGHRMRLVVAGGSVNYRGGLLPVPVTVVAGAGQDLTIPVVP